MRSLVVACVALLGAAAASADGPALPLPLRFDSEVVRLTIEPESLRVDGLYRLACAPGLGTTLSLFYPYPRDSLMGGARTLMVEARPKDGVWSPIEYRELPGRGARWIVPPCASDTLEIRTIYRQARRAPHAIYVVTTTRAWGRPLRRARFEIFLPVRLVTEPRFSYPFVPMAPRSPEGFAGFVYETEGFMPDREITVDWTPAQVP